MDRKEENSSTYKLAYELISTDGRIAYVDAANGAVVNYDYWLGCYEPGDLVALRVWHWKENSTEFDFKRIKAQARVNRACAFIITDLLYIHCEQYCFSGLMVSWQREMMLSTLAYIYAYKCWQLQHIVVYKNYHCSLCTICRSVICIAHVVKIVLEEHHAPVWDQGHCSLVFQWLCCEKFSRGSFHLYAALPPCYDVPVLKASSI